MGKSIDEIIEELRSKLNNSGFKGAAKAVEIAKAISDTAGPELVELAEIAATLAVGKNATKEELQKAKAEYASRLLAALAVAEAD